LVTLSFGIFFPAFVNCTNKNLATLDADVVESPEKFDRPSKKERKPRPPDIFEATLFQRT
jgi:hypothetical protein